MSLDVIAVILGRKGSKGLPGKNTMRLLGRPISHYPIMAARQSRHVSDIYLSTDDEKIVADARAFGVDVIDRPAHLCTDKALFEDALVHGYREATGRRGRKPDIVVILMCNAATVDASLIDAAVEALRDDPAADSAVSVTLLNMYSPLRARKKDAQGYLVPFVPFESFGDPKTLNCDRDSQGDVYFADMSHSVSRSRSLDAIEDGLLPQRWMGKKILPVYNTFGCDIDADWQTGATLHWLKARGFTEKKTPYED